MPPMTTRALRVTVLAAGLAAAGTSTASAATTPGMEGLRSAPDEINKHQLVNACRAQEAPHPERCPEIEAGVQSPTVLKQVGVEVVRHGHELRQDLSRPGLPLDDEQVGRAAGAVGGVVRGVEAQTAARPNVDAAVRPGEQPLMRPNSPNSRFLDTHVGPRGRTHQGVSALDTAVDAHAVQGYDIGQGTLPREFVLSLPPEAGMPKHPVPAEAGVPKHPVPAEAGVPKHAVARATSAPQQHAARLDQQVLPPAQQVVGDLGERVEHAGRSVDGEAGKLLHAKTLPLQVDEASALQPGR